MTFQREEVASSKGWRWGVVLLAAVAGCAGEKKEVPSPEQEALRAAEQASLQLSPPAGCTEITLGELQNGTELTPVLYGSQPTYRGEFSSFGDPAVADAARIRLDVNTAPGLHELAAGGTNLFQCEQCVWGYQDLGSPAQKMFVAESGQLLLARKVSPQQTLGALSNVVLRESVNAPPTGVPYAGSAPVPGGECRWIRFATWNTIRPGGCDPRDSSVTANFLRRTCVADDAAATDGTMEWSLGAKKQGEACQYTPAASTSELASTDCAQGYACSGAYTDERQCLVTCDFMAADPGCPTGTVCGVYGLCIEQAVMEPIGYLFEPALIGESCSVGFAEFCGVEGARGLCADVTRSGTGTCYPYKRARSECGAGEELGYISYPLPGGGSDRTYGFCYPDGR
ncbi:hypothetical protein [Hyalangium minutum]|uniref:Putative lipoprotein n=1 Tax=Hyalangium minutum TaxID=394096 RepID=A0A085WWM6_9BACT|nr:hypothetical protein [Hyalangium minutum]KFE72089.1 putative lipoprotein [Hyalangium minutum]